MKSKIGLVTLGVNNFQKSFKFYNEGLGFKTHNYKIGDDFAVFEMDGTWLSIYPKEKLAEDITISSDGKGFSGFTLAHNVKTKEEVDKVFNHAIKAGARPIKRPQDVFWGGYSGYFADPDNYYWEIAYNPFTDLT
ncbi:MAG: Glyoxalase family protein [candidate division WS6 bacterium GW2011_GWF2_39_15]|uniref:Glyoxalase family protein n=1 Tax=candidate division WS6 bacterium GW2011_GWF2_39_15 TaxID=1619100 RepID=A0A0G0QWJ9_9BACT|nr:MAG: Glyoxalase family protein [candidate division WS6 bacterium GW2011_GWF2_39_15]